MFTIHYLNSRANGSLITPITFTYSLQSRANTIGPSRITQLIPQDFSGVTEVKFTTPIYFPRIFWCKRLRNFSDRDNTGWCNFPGNYTYYIPRNHLV